MLIFIGDCREEAAKNLFPPERKFRTKLSSFLTRLLPQSFKKYCFLVKSCISYIIGEINLYKCLAQKKLLRNS